MKTLTVVSYNIHRARSLDNRVDVGRIADVLRETGADVVGLQEVFASNAVLSRLAVKDHYRFDLTRPGREPRGGLRVDLDTGRILLHLFNVHFGLRFREDRKSTRLNSSHIQKSRMPSSA